MTFLIVNADDFGLTSGVNRAVLELHQAGVLTSTTLMANATATKDAIELARDNPTLGVGCHVVLVDGEPLLSARQDIPNLADPVGGRFHSSLVGFLDRLYRRRPLMALSPLVPEIEAEATAQIASLQKRGVRLTHVDTHKHLHMFPAVLRPVLRAAKAAGIRTVRNPFEPRWSLCATPDPPWQRRAEVTLLRWLEPTFRRIVAEEGFTTTDGAIGVLATGTLNAATIDSLLKALPDGTFELVSHPGYNDEDLAQAHTRLLGSRETERSALRTLKSFPDLELISFAGVNVPLAAHAAR